MNKYASILLAGPCSVETQEQVMQTAQQIHTFAPHAIFRAGLWKPRTSPNTFAGVGQEGLEWLIQVQQTIGMQVATEVVTPEHIQLCWQAGIHHLWIGARTTANPIMVQALADALRTMNMQEKEQITIYIKNPINPDINLWIGALERFQQAGINHIVAVHRGFSTLYQGEWRNAPMWSVPIELKRRYPNLPLLCDPSHIAGDTKRIEQLAHEAMMIGLDGLMIECHHCPQQAWSDAAQQLTPTDLQALLNNLPKYHQQDDTHIDTTLVQLRQQIDEIDNELWQLVVKRLEIAQTIGEYKRTQQMPILQRERYEAILQKRIEWAKEQGLSEDIVRRLMETLHTESVKRQL